MMTWTSTKRDLSATAPRGRRRGFTLVEALVSLVIAAIAFAALVRVASTSVLTKIKSEDYSTAVLLAEMKLSDVRLDGPSLYGEEEGEFDEPYEDFRWRVTTIESEDMSGLYSVEVEITWPTRGEYTTKTFLYEAGLDVVAQE